MSVWDLRQAWESAIPAWVSVAVLVVCIVIVAVFMVARHGRR